MMRRVVVGYSGGVTSAWAAAWALRTFPASEVTWLFHDTKEEDADTYRFLREFARVVGHPITEQSDGRSVTEVFYDENAIANNRMAFCSRILKAEQRDIYFDALRERGYTDIVNVLGFSAHEEERVQRATARSWQGGFSVRFPLIEEQVTKQQASDYCWSLGVRPPAMYEWSDHANCVGCVRGGKAYWLAVAEHHPLVFAQRSDLEKEFGHTVLKDMTLEELKRTGLKRKVNRREAIDIGPCECGA